MTDPGQSDPLAPLHATTTDGMTVVAQLGQSLDGRIATESGHSHYVNGEAGLVHLHRLRAFADAVVVGVGTVVADDPRLTVRRIAGRQPARVIIDPRGRVSATARALADDGVRCLVLGSVGARNPFPAHVEQVQLARAEGHITPGAILASLAGLGFRRILVEGGADTVSRFLAANCLDRLHVLVAPLILGSGLPGIALPPITRASDGLRPPTRVHMLGSDVLFDCDLSAWRVPITATRRLG